MWNGPRGEPTTYVRIRAVSTSQLAYAAVEAVAHGTTACLLLQQGDALLLIAAIIIASHVNAVAQVALAVITITLTSPSSLPSQYRTAPHGNASPVFSVFLLISSF